MSKEILRVLIVEDKPADAELLERKLASSGYVPLTRRVQTAADMRAALDAEWDLILSGYMMPSFTGLQALGLLKETGKDIPFILISGSAGDDIAIAAMSAGAHDFFTKGNLGLLVSAIQRELREAKLRSAANAQREQLHEIEKLAVLGTLLAGIAHELNNPLSVIMHQATLLAVELDSDPALVRAASILQAVSACSRIVKSVLAQARQDPPRRVAVCINDVVRDAIDLVAYGLKIDDIRVELELAATMPDISADPQQLERMVINLVSNAQYALRSRPMPRILTLRSIVHADEGFVVLEIADSGIGISPEIRSRIFEPFFTSKPAGEGTGLGLALCRGIVTAHNGTISVSSELTVGTTFVITLPIGHLPVATDHGVIPKLSSTPGKSILVVDDDPHVAMALSEMLTFQGHIVEISGSSREALLRIVTGAYDIIVTDMRMPDLDGPALYREVTASHPNFADSFLFVTGDAFSSETDRFLRETGAVHLSKPCTFEEVGSAVAQVVRRRSRIPAVH
jgi:signal transduction histidine kinase